MNSAVEPVLTDKKTVCFSVRLDETLHQAILGDVKAARAARRAANKNTVIRDILNSHYFPPPRTLKLSKNKPTNHEK